MEIIKTKQVENKFIHFKNKSWSRFGIEQKNIFNHIDSLVFILLAFVIPFICSIIARYVLEHFIKVNWNKVYWDFQTWLNFFCYTFLLLYYSLKIKLNFYKTHGYLFFIGILFLKFTYMFLSLIFSFLNNSNVVLGIIDSVLKIGLCIMFIIVNKPSKDWFKKIFNSKNWWISLIIILIGFLIFFLLQFGLGAISRLLNNGGNSNNQDSIEQQVNKNQIITIINLFLSAVIVAPIFEEIIYRYYVFYFCQDKWYGLVVTILWFASLHVMNYGDFQNIFPYLALGIVSGSIYYITGNILYGISIHFIGNLIGFITIVIKIMNR